MGVPESEQLQFSEMVALVRRDDPEGMADLYGCLSRGLRPYLARQLAPQDIQDHVHDVFVELVRAIRKDQLRDPERLIAFARTVARRKVAVHIDVAAQKRRNESAFESVFNVPSSLCNPEGELIFRQQRDLVGHALTQLSGPERDVLTRFYLQEQDQSQICAEMGLTETQFRLLKWRSKARFTELSRKVLTGRRGMGRQGVGRSAVPVKAIPA